MSDGRERYLRVVGRTQGGGAKGDSSRLVPLTPGLHMRLDRYVRRGRPECNTDRLFVTHLFRHSLATNLLRKHVNPVQGRDIVGHTSLAMIDRVYSHLAASDAHQALMEALRADE